MIWGLATSHVPSIGAAMDRGKTEDPYWRPLFDGYAPARAWMARHTPDVAVVVYNDHANAVDMSVTPTFAVGAAASYEVADEGWGSRPVPTVVGAPEFSDHLVESLVDSSFDITVFQDLAVDHGLTVPLSVYCPDPGRAGRVPSSPSWSTSSSTRSPRRHGAWPWAGPSARRSAPTPRTSRSPSSVPAACPTNSRAPARD
ncbi:hypothetical protein [Streptomyces stelliscabiei]|uniref:DODA-type extradiol aromatic ring-opening family dioxygenase n=1 Tax=Streptomyces stelliscabiei TaxID=146820 RepID=UPI003A8D3FC2